MARLLLDVGAENVHLDSEQRWQMLSGFRSIVLGLLCASSLAAAAMLLVPELYSGCDAAALGIIPTLTVLVFMPVLTFYANHTCHKNNISHSKSKAIFVPLLLGYYLPIIYKDSATHVVTGNITMSACPLSITTASNHASDTMMLVDIACNFFICACLLEAWRTRAIHVLCHATLWASDNYTYPSFTSAGTRAQRVWHWAGFIVVEAQMMATIVAIAHAIDVMLESQQAKARAESRVVQIQNEKERLVWDARLKEHRGVLLEGATAWVHASLRAVSEPMDPRGPEALQTSLLTKYTPGRARHDSGTETSLSTAEQQDKSPLSHRSHHTAKLSPEAARAANLDLNTGTGHAFVLHDARAHDYERIGPPYCIRRRTSSSPLRATSACE